LTEHHTTPDATIVEARRGEYLISTDPARLDVDAIHDYLANHSYWAQGRPREVVARSIRHSLCLGIYRGAEQVGFARVVTDYATQANLVDVFVLEPHRGRGLGKWLVETALAHPALETVPRWRLNTSDAHGLYSRYGFKPISEPENAMTRG
jgi:GNAT superfamily N-acetyltransferase